MAKWSDMTAEERSKEMKRRRAKAKANKRKITTRTRARRSHGDEASNKEHTAYIYGKVETIIEYYARSNGLPFSTLASGVASLLRHKAHG